MLMRAFSGGRDVVPGGEKLTLLKLTNVRFPLIADIDRRRHYALRRRRDLTEGSAELKRLACVPSRERLSGQGGVVKRVSELGVVALGRYGFLCGVLAVGACSHPGPTTQTVMTPEPSGSVSVRLVNRSLLPVQVEIAGNHFQVGSLSHAVIGFPPGSEIRRVAREGKGRLLHVIGAGDGGRDIPVG